MTRQDDYMVLEGEFLRIGTTGYEAFRQLSNLNDPRGHQIAVGEPVNVAFDVRKTLELIRSLPDAAGVQVFIDRFIAEFASRRPPPPFNAGPGVPDAEHALEAVGARPRG